MSLTLAAPGLADPPSRPLEPASAREEQLIVSTEQRVQTLRAMLDRRDLPERGVRLFQLARLELELAVLREAAAPGTGDLEAPSLSCRRLLVEEPSYRGRAEVQMFLARLELRRGRPRDAITVLRELQSNRLPSGVLCDSHLLAGEVWTADRRPDLAAESYRRALGGPCGVAARQQARYRLAWALLATGRSPEAGRELVELLDQPIPERLRQRALADLTVAWSHGEPPDDAARLLLSHDRQGGGRLLQQLAESLLAAGRLEPLLRVTSALPATIPADVHQKLRGLRLRALARFGARRRFEEELGSLRREPGAAVGLTAEIARCEIELAARLLRSERSALRAEAEKLYRRATVGSSGPEVQLARLQLAELRRRRGDLEGAAADLEAARAATGPHRARASLLLLQILEEQLAARPAGQRADARSRLTRAAWRHVGDTSSGAETAEVLLLLAAHELAGERFAEAARAAERLVTRFPRHPRRSEAVRLGLQALERAGEWERAYWLATRDAATAAPRTGALRGAAARAALRRASELARRADLGGAELWIRRALDGGGDPEVRGEAELAAALLAVRQHDFARAEVALRDLSQRPFAKRVRTLRMLAELQEARGAFAAAARSYLLASGSVAEAGTRAPASSVKERLELLRRAAIASTVAARPVAARATARELGRALERQPLPAADRLRWQLRVGRLLEAAGGAARSHYLRLARQLEREQPRMAARMLIRAAARAPRPSLAAADLERARQLAGPLRRRDQLNREAADAELELVRLERQRLGRARPAARLLGLQRALPLALALVSAGDATLAAEAGLEVARIYQTLAETLQAGLLPPRLRPDEREGYRAAVAGRVGELRARARELLTRIARQGAATPSSFEAGRLLADASMPPLRADHRPPSSPAAAPALALLQAGRPRAAALAARRSLELLGERADLLCVLALAHLARQQPARAQQDLRLALEANPASRCARLNLGALALQRGDVSAAAEVLEPVQPPDAALAAALAVPRRPGAGAPTASLARPGPQPAALTPATAQADEPGLELLQPATSNAKLPRTNNSRGAP